MTLTTGLPLHLRPASKFQVQLILESLEKTVILQLDLYHRVIYYKNKTFAEIIRTK